MQKKMSKRHERTTSLCTSLFRHRGSVSITFCINVAPLIKLPPGKFNQKVD